MQEELTVQGELQQRNDELRALATTDELTGLRNRRRFFEDLGAHFAQSSRGRAPLSLVLLDVDHFKRYNDAFGHPAGDDVLKGVADALQAVTRDYDTVARHGGEEFAVILPGTGLDVARGMAERLRAAVERHAWPHRPVTASFGVATAFPRTGDARAIVDEADRALYFSKRGGRNRVTHHADLGDVLVEAPLADSAVPLWSHSRPGPPFDEAGGVPTASPGGQVPTCDDFVDGWAALCCSATAGRSTTADGPPRWCSSWQGSWELTRPRCPTSAAAPCSTTSARSASPTRSCSSPGR